MSESKYEKLKLSNQLCFPIYACSRLTTKHYRQPLEELDLTYTQYITMLVLWEDKKTNVKELGKKLYLDSGTLTPVLKSLEEKGYVSRQRSTEDERVLNVEVTQLGKQLKDKALPLPDMMRDLVCSRGFTAEECDELSRLLKKFIELSVE